jgi:isopentenyl diphosphate isomerase/L-lactate dehydrogenase-like FMN-dependent dehydrogenase
VRRFSASSRRLDRLFAIEDAREMARRLLPKMIFDFVDGGADREVTLRANCSDFDQIELVPRGLVDVSHRELSIDLFGARLSSPILLAPAGFAGVVGNGGESATAKAAARFGTKFVLSTQSNQSIERVVTAAPGAVWFQLYPWRNESTVESLIGRADAAGCEALFVTIDVPAVGNRLRDLRNGATLPPRLTFASVLGVARHPNWVRKVLLRRDLGFANLEDLVPRAGTATIGEFVNENLVDPAATWTGIEKIRNLWPRTLVIKGVMSGEDARRAVALGADGVVVSNHGGRQLDGVASTIRTLSSVVGAVGSDTAVLLDGGVRSGSDVLKALALGARACLIGRPYLWGVAVAGEEGALKVLNVLTGELSRALALLGYASVQDLNRDSVRPPPGWDRRGE